MMPSPSGPLPHRQHRRVAGGSGMRLLPRVALLCGLLFARPAGVWSDVSTGALARGLGVAPALADAYAINDDESFHCLDGTETLPYELLNDDYCDCSDGTDEPGTSACSGVTALSPKSNGFYCANRGYEGLVVPSSRVNDGICDCCDGSDEWGRATPCPDDCSALAVTANERNAVRAAVVRLGIAARAALEATGAQQREAQEAEVARLKALVDSAKPGFEQLKERFARWEAAEEGRAVVEAAALRRPRQVDGNLNAHASGAPSTMREWASSLQCTQDFDCPVAQSSFNWLGEAFKAVDGNDSADYDKDLSCVHTDNAAGTTSWWQVDLGAEVAVDHITIQNRRDPNAARLNGARIFVGGGLCEGYVDGEEPGGACAVSGRIACGDDTTKYTGISGAADSSLHTLPCSGAVGQFVTVIMGGGDSSGRWLSFCEVQVWGTAVEHSVPSSLPAIDGSMADLVTGDVDKDDVIAARIARCELADMPELSQRRCPAHPERQRAYRFITDGLYAESSCDSLEETICGTVCSLQCLPGYAPRGSNGAEDTQERLVCDANGMWQRIRTVDHHGTPRGRWSCELQPPPTPRVISITPLNHSLALEVQCGSEDSKPGSDGGEPTNYTVSVVPSQCTADGYCFGVPVTQDFDSVTSCQVEAQQQEYQPLKTVKLTISGLTNEAAYSMTVRASNAGGMTSSQSRTQVAPTALADEYATALADYSALRTAWDDKHEELVQVNALLSDAQRGLQDTCVEQQQGKYTYRICLFKKCEQQDSGSYTWTSLGRWDPSAAQIPEQNEDENSDKETSAAMHFTGGERCWNGPLRSTTVLLECGATTEILTISERETCTYEMQLATPAVCSEADIPRMYG